MCEELYWKQVIPLLNASAHREQYDGSHVRACQTKKIVQHKVQVVKTESVKFATTLCMLWLCFIRFEGPGSVASFEHYGSHVRNVFGVYSRGQPVDSMVQAVWT